jgi:hypothetical protein
MRRKLWTILLLLGISLGGLTACGDDVGGDGQNVPNTGAQDNGDGDEGGDD